MMVAGVVIVVGTVASAEIGLLLFVFITYTRFSDIMADQYKSLSVAKFFVGLLIVAIFIRWALLGQRPVGWQLPALLLGLYGLIGFLSLSYAPNSESVVTTLSNYGKDALITIVIIMLLKRPPAFRHLIWILLAVGIFLGSLSVFQYLTGTFTNPYGGFARAEFKEISDNAEARGCGSWSTKYLNSNIYIFARRVPGGSHSAAHFLPCVSTSTPTIDRNYLFGDEHVRVYPYYLFRSYPLLAGSPARSVRKD
jgi:hypothetical protein